MYSVDLMKAFAAAKFVVRTSVFSALCLLHMAFSQASTGQLDLSGFVPLDPGILPVYKLAANIQMPFPGKPVSEGVHRMQSVRQHLYRYADDATHVGYTATVMQDSIRIDGPPQSILHGFILGTMEVLNAEIVSQETLTVDGAPALAVMAYVKGLPITIRSHTVAIYDNGKVHSWAMQDFPELTGDKAAEIFRANLRSIKLSGENR